MEEQLNSTPIFTYLMILITCFIFMLGVAKMFANYLPEQFIINIERALGL